MSPALLNSLRGGTHWRAVTKVGTKYMVRIKLKGFFILSRIVDLRRRFHRFWAANLDESAGRLAKVFVIKME